MDERQIRNACFEKQPKFRLHDNDGKFGQRGRPLSVERAGKRISCRSTFDAWLWQVMNIRGNPIPYGAPNAAAHIERLIGMLRRECLDRMLIWNERHLRATLTKFNSWYNHSRVHQGSVVGLQPFPCWTGCTTTPAWLRSCAACIRYQHFRQV